MQILKIFQIKKYHQNITDIPHKKRRLLTTYKFNKEYALKKQTTHYKDRI